MPPIDNTDRQFQNISTYLIIATKQTGFGIDLEAMFRIQDNNQYCEKLRFTSSYATNGQHRHTISESFNKSVIATQQMVIAIDLCLWLITNADREDKAIAAVGQLLRVVSYLARLTHLDHCTRTIDTNVCSIFHFCFAIISFASVSRLSNVFVSRKLVHWNFSLP